MWRERRNSSGGNAKFFYVSMVHDSLANMYQLNFAMMQHHNYSLTELDGMIPFEREIYVTLLKNFLDEQEEQQRNQ